MRAAAIVALGLGLAACAAPPQQANHPTTGQVLAASNCLYKVASAEAWLNLMPGPAKSVRQLHVVLKLVEPQASALLLRSDASTPDTLVLDLRGAQELTVPGQVDYAEPATEPPKRISILCRGAEIHAITDIQRVY